jgi:hypothetical protein
MAITHRNTRTSLKLAECDGNSFCFFKNALPATFLIQINPITMLSNPNALTDLAFKLRNLNVRISTLDPETQKFIG